jgi:hypothetical protein
LYTIITKTKNIFSEAGMPTLLEMREINSSKTAIRILTISTPYKTLYFIKKNIHDEYACKPKTTKPIFIRSTENFGNLNKDVRKIEKQLPTADSHVRGYNTIKSTYNLRKYQTHQASKDSKRKPMNYSTKNTKITQK